MFEFIRKFFRKQVLELKLKPGNGGLKKLKDLTEELNARSNLLQESEKKYRTFVEHFPGIAYKGSLDFIPEFFHGAVEDLTGYTEEEFLKGSPRWDQIIHPKDLKKFMEDSDKICTEQFSDSREYRIITKSGKIKWICERISNVCDENGIPVSVQGTLNDITVEHEAKENLYLTQFVSDNSFNPIFWVDNAANFVYANKKASEVLGYTREELTKMKVFDIDPDHTDMKYWRNHWKELKEKEILVFKTRHKTKTGKIIRVEITANYVEYRDKEVLISFIQILSKPITKTARKKNKI